MRFGSVRCGSLESAVIRFGSKFGSDRPNRRTEPLDLAVRFDGSFWTLLYRKNDKSFTWFGVVAQRWTPQIRARCLFPPLSGSCWPSSWSWKHHKVITITVKYWPCDRTEPHRVSQSWAILKRYGWNTVTVGLRLRFGRFAGKVNISTVVQCEMAILNIILPRKASHRRWDIDKRSHSDRDRLMLMFSL